LRIALGRGKGEEQGRGSALVGKKLESSAARFLFTVNGGWKRSGAAVEKKIYGEREICEDIFLFFTEKSQIFLNRDF
jgi:hypothetical protein